MTESRQELSVRTDFSIERVLLAAVERGVDADAMAKLVDLQMRVMDKNAEMAFNRAFQDFQAECPSVEKNKLADTGKFKYRYANLDHIVDVVRPILRKHGLSFTFDSEESHVVCTLHHVDGHSRSARIALPPYKFDKINDLQCEGVRNSYGRRYAMLNVLGITTGDEDTDGNGERSRKTSGKTASPTLFQQLKDGFKNIRGGGEEAFRQWADSVCSVPASRALRIEAWTDDAIEAGWRDLNGGGEDAFSV